MLPSFLRCVWMRAARRCSSLRSECGSSLVELAFFFSFIGMPVLLGTVQAGTLVFYYIEISNAAHAAALYGMTSATIAGDNADIITAAQNDASDFGTHLTVTPTVFYVCSNSVGGTQYSSQAAANSACSGSGNHALEFIQVVTSAPVTPVLHLPGTAASATLTATSTMEVEE